MVKRAHEQREEETVDQLVGGNSVKVVVDNGASRSTEGETGGTGQG